MSQTVELASSFQSQQPKQIQEDGMTSKSQILSVPQIPSNGSNLDGNVQISTKSTFPQIFLEKRSKQIVQFVISSDDQDVNITKSKKNIHNKNNKKKSKNGKSSSIDGDYCTPKSKSSKRKKLPNQSKLSKIQQSSNSQTSSSSSSSTSSDSYTSNISKTKNKASSKEQQESAKRRGEQMLYALRQRNKYRKGLSLPAEFRPGVVLIEKSQINDPQLEKQMENILYNLSKEIRPKGKRRTILQQYKPKPQDAKKAFNSDAFAFKDDSTIKRIVEQKFIDSPFMPPSLRKRPDCTEKSNSQDNQLNQASQSLIGNQDDFISKQGQSQSKKKKNSQKNKNKCDEEVECIPISTASSQKKNKELELIQEYQQKAKTRSQSITSKPEVFFNKSSVEQYLFNLSKK